jgi:hypothetical protein
MVLFMSNEVDNGNESFVLNHLKRFQMGKDFSHELRNFFYEITKKYIIMTEEEFVVHR